MPEQDPLNELVREFGPAVASAVGPLPFAGTSWSPPASMLDANTIGSEILGVTIDLSKGRKALLGALERAFPLKKGASGSSSTAIEYRRGTDAIAANPSDFPLVGPTKIAAIALQALSDHANVALDEIEPIDPHAAGHCDHEPIVALVRSTIEALNQQFASGRPLVQAVDVLVETLIGKTPGADETPLSGIKDVGGYIGDLGKRIGFAPDVPHGQLEHEKIATSYGGLAVFARVFAEMWRDARTANDAEFFTIGVQELQRHLFAIVTTLNRLRGAVTADRWLGTEIPTEPPMVAAAFWQWMHRYSGTTALEMLRQGRDGIFGLNRTMTGFADVLKRLIAEEPPRKTKSPTPAYPCDGVPGAFEDEDVQDIVRELYCHVQRLVEATKSAGRTRC